LFAVFVREHTQSNCYWAVALMGCWFQKYTGHEDLPVSFGSVLATQTRRIQTQEDGSGTGNNEEPETISRVVLEVPLDNESKTYAFSGEFVPTADGNSSGYGTAEVELDTTAARVYTTTSTIIRDADDIAQLSQVDRNLAEADIRATLDTFVAQMGPSHTDEDGVSLVMATTLDVGVGVCLPIL
jgi:hypothetical protein